MKSYQEFLHEQKYRWTVYALKQDAKSNDPKAEFLEYLNNDELDDWMLANASKRPMIAVVRSDGKWNTYDQPSGKSYKKALSGANFNKEWKGRYNKKADV